MKKISQLIDADLSREYMAPEKKGFPFIFVKIRSGVSFYKVYRIKVTTIHSINKNYIKDIRTRKLLAIIW